MSSTHQGDIGDVLHKSNGLVRLEFAVTILYQGTANTTLGTGEGRDMYTLSFRKQKHLFWLE